MIALKLIQIHKSDLIKTDSASLKQIQELFVHSQKNVHQVCKQSTLTFVEISACGIRHWSGQFQGYLAYTSARASIEL